ncbi:MAG: AMP-binding protein, partial [Desulfobacterales bacterium]|nr:AMP-binding protein [Desulfobacterales bacterium]
MAKGTRFTQEMIDAYLEAGQWTRETLSELWDRNAQKYPDNEAVVDSRTRLTWAQARQWINRLALGLLEAGLKKDDMVVMQLPNCVELMVLIVACEKAGLLSLPVLRTFRHNEMSYILNHVQAAGVVIPSEFRGFDYFNMIRTIQQDAKKLDHIYFVGDKAPEGYQCIAELAARPIEKQYPADYLKQRTCPSTEVSLVVNTSGSTGFPKFVEYPIAARFCSAKGRVIKYRYTHEDTFGIFGAGIGTAISAYFAAPLVGSKVIMMEHFDAEEALRLVEREGITLIGSAPAILTMMVRHPNFDKYDMSSLRLVESGGAPLPYEAGL